MNNIELSCIVNESLSTHYLIYKITNKINGKYYIGQHKTNDVYDNYMGSGKIILEAEDKYGLSAFTKTILFDFDNFDDMNNKEKELVQLSNCWPYDLMSYNLKEGGNNGSLSEESKMMSSLHCKEAWKNKSKEELLLFKQKISTITRGENNGMFNNGHLISGENNGMYGIHRYGKQNPMYGKCGKNSPNYGKKRSTKQKLNMSIAAKNRKQSKLRSKALSKQRANTKHMYNPITYVGKFVKIEDIESFKLQGWKLGKYK